MDRVSSNLDDAGRPSSQRPQTGARHLADAHQPGSARGLLSSLNDHRTLAGPILDPLDSHQLRTSTAEGSIEPNGNFTVGIVQTRGSEFPPDGPRKRIVSLRVFKGQVIAPAVVAVAPSEHSPIHEKSSLSIDERRRAFANLEHAHPKRDHRIALDSFDHPRRGISPQEGHRPLGAVREPEAAARWLTVSQPAKGIEAEAIVLPIIGSEPLVNRSRELMKVVERNGFGIR